MTPHVEKYEKAMNEYGKKELQNLVLSVFTIDELKEAYKITPYFNSDAGEKMNITTWDHLATGYVSPRRIKEHCTGITPTLAQMVSLLKTAARSLVIEEERA